MKIEQYTAPRLMTAAQEEIIDVLNYKLEEVGVSGTTDYIGLTLELLEDQKERLKVAIKDLQAMVKQADGRALIIKEEVNKLLETNGIDRIEGDRVSSITTFQPKPKEKLIVHDKEAVIEMGFIKTAIDETKLKQEIHKYPETFKDIAELEVVHVQPTVRINKRMTI